MENNITSVILNFNSYSIISLNSSESYSNNPSDTTINTVKIKDNQNMDFITKSSSIMKEINSTIPKSEEKIVNETNNTTIIQINNTFSSELYLTHINDIINNTIYNDNHLNNSINMSNEKNKNNKNEINMNNIDTTILDYLTDQIKENDSTINKTIINQINILNNTNGNNNNATKNNSFIKNIRHEIMNNIKKIDKKYITGIEILLPLIIIIIFIFFIVYLFKKRKKKLVIQEQNNNLDKNGMNFQSSVNKAPYNRLQNTSGFNVGLNPNNYSMSEIKVQNLKDEIHNIITNNSGGSNSSGKRKREKRKIANNNSNFSSQEKNKGIQNEMKEEIKQYVIDEHLNNS